MMTLDLAWLSSAFPDIQSLAPLEMGGQKWVYSGRHAQDGEVVLKIFIPRQDQEMVQREFAATRQVTSARVPQIFDSGVVQTNLGTCFWFREARVPGDSLQNVLASGPLDPADTMRLGRDIMEVAADAARVHIVHRDIKPGNIIRDRNNRFWLIDFGCARHLELASLTADHAQYGKGTCGYSAPEQMRNQKKQIDERADIFAIGVTMIHAATGSNPFAAPTPIERLRRSETFQVPRLALPMKDPDALADLVEAMVQKRRDQRPKNIGEAREWLEQIMINEGVR